MLIQRQTSIGQGSLVDLPRRAFSAGNENIGNISDRGVCRNGHMKKTTKSFAGQMIRVCLFGIVMPLVAIELLFLIGIYGRRAFSAGNENIGNISDRGVCHLVMPNLFLEIDEQVPLCHAVLLLEIGIQPLSHSPVR